MKLEIENVNHCDRCGLYYNGEKASSHTGGACYIMSMVIKIMAKYLGVALR